jgi:hypothetical protein
MPTTITPTWPCYLEVDLLEMQISLPLTHAWHNTLNSTKQLVVTHDLFGFGQIGQSDEMSRQLVGQKVLVVKIVLGRVRILWLLVVTALLLGISVGLASGRLEIGVAVFAIVLASVSTLHGLSVLIER